METESSTKLFYKMNLEAKLSEFKHLTDISDRMDLVYHYIKTSCMFREFVRDDEKINKSNTKSEECRTKGNDYFHSQFQYLKALECYTESIALGEQGSRELALAYGNRSAVLFQRGYYKESVEDLNRALLLDHPKKEKLLMRKSAAESCFAQEKSVTYYNEAPKIRSVNHNTPFASDSVEINYNKKLGRHIIATKDIEIGDVISVEPSFCHVIHSDSKYIHCHHCLKLCYNLIPCNNCSDALYCSEKCMNTCYEEYHKFVCHFPRILLCNGMVFVKLALVGMSCSKKPVEKIPHETHKFKEILNLATNEDNLDPFTLCRSAIIPCIAYHVLKENAEFISTYGSEEDNKHLKELLYKSFLINSFNPFNIEKITYSTFVPETKKLATALYAFSSLYNHSCVQNCEFYHYGSLIVTRAIDHIKMGEQVTICYGRSFSTTEKSTRQSILKMAYFFDCECEACKKDWPTLAYLPLGREIPLTFIQKCEEYKWKYGDGKSNERLLTDLLTEGKRLYYELRKCRPSQNLLEIQDLITELFISHCSWNFLF